MHAALRDASVDFEAVDYYTDPIPKAKLKELLDKMGINARQLLRTKEEQYKKLRLGERELTDDEIIDAMVKHPDLIRGRSSRRGEERSWRGRQNGCARSCNEITEITEIAEITDQHGATEDTEDARSSLLLVPCDRAGERAHR